MLRLRRTRQAEELKKQREMRVLNSSTNRDHVACFDLCMFAQASSNELQDVFVVSDIGKVQINTAVCFFSNFYFPSVPY
jgi:hypothetical protein